MEKQNKLRTFGNLGLLAIALVAVGYYTYGKLKERNEKEPVKVRDTTIAAAQPVPALNDSLVAFGMQYLGTPYTAGGCSKDGFDCSGFVYFVYRHFNIEVPRSSADFEHFGKEIPIEFVRKGDLLLFLSPTRNVIGHIGIVSEAKGKSSDFIHASSGREMKVIITSLATAGYTRRFVKAVRVL